MTQPAYKRSYSKVARKALTLFEKYLQAAGRTAPTQAVYLRIVRHFLAEAPDWRAPDPAWLRRHFGARRRAIAASTFNLELSALRAFYRFACEFQLVTEDIATRLPCSHRAPEKLPVTMSPGRVEQLLALPDRSSLIGLRDAVMLSLVWECGIRAGELVALTLGDVLHEDGFVHVGATGSSCERVVPFSFALEKLLTEWIERRTELRPGKSNTLFVTHRGKPFRSARSVWEIVNKYISQAVHLGGSYQLLARQARYAPWQAPASPQAIRGTFAATLLGNRCDLRSLQEMLGHANIQTTARFEKVDVKRLKREHEKLFRRRRSK